jgi:serine/threonine-protein kinase
MSENRNDPELDPGPPTRAPRIETRGDLARGGMSWIRRVHDRLLERDMAMKVLDLDIAHAQLHARFMREAQVLAQLDHPHIVPLYECATDDNGTPCFTMKLIEGTTLTQLVAELDLAADARGLHLALDVLLKVCDALAFAHGRGVVHRDVKPDNVMVGSHGQVYLMDWGVVRLLSDEQLARAGIPRERAVTCDRRLEGLGPEGIVGTPGYMALEQAWGHDEDIDERTDVYGVGGLLYFILTGQPPHAGADLASEVELARVGFVKPPQEVVPHRSLPRGLCNVAMRALSAPRERRYQTIEALRHELERFLRGGTFQSERFAPGTPIIRENEVGNAAYLITQGHCEASKIEAGRPIVLRTMGPGDLFGEMAILTSTPRTATVTAIDDVTALTISREALEEWLALDSWMGTLVRSLAERFRDTDAQLTELRRTYLKLYVREQLLTAVARTGTAAWRPLCKRLCADTQLTELDILAIAADSDDLALEQAGDTIRVPQRRTGRTTIPPSQR